MSTSLSENHRPGTDLANKLRSTTAWVVIPCWTTISDNGDPYVSFKICLESPHSSTTVNRRYGKFSELHNELSKQFSGLELPAFPLYANTLNGMKIDEQRVMLEKYLNNVVKFPECWSCPAFGEFFCVQAEVGPVELTNDIIGRILMLGEENMVISEQLKATSDALMDATAHIQQLENRLANLEQGVSHGRPPTSRSGSVSMSGTADRVGDNTPILQLTQQRPKHRFSYVSTASDMDSIASNSVCFDDVEPLPSPSRSNGVPKLCLPDSRKFRRPSEQRSTYFSLAGDVLYESDCDHRAVMNTLNNVPMQEDPSDFDTRIDELLVSVLPQKVQLSQRVDVRSFISNEIFKTLGVHAIDIGHYRLKSFLPDESIELGISLGVEEEQTWCDKLCKDLGCLGVEAGGAGNAPMYSIADLAATPPGEKNSRWMLRFSVGTVFVCITTVSKADLCTVAFLEEVDQLVGRDHLFKRSVILVKAWWLYESEVVVGNAAPAWTPHTWLLCSLVCFIFNKHHERIFHPLHAMVFFFKELAYFDWKNNILSVCGKIPKGENLKHGPDCELDSPLICSDVISKYRDLALNFTTVEDMTPRDSFDQNFAGVFVEHPLLSGTNLLHISIETDPDSSTFVISLKAGVLLLCSMINSGPERRQESVNHMFAETIHRFGSSIKKDANLAGKGRERDEPQTTSRTNPSPSTLNRSDSLSSWWNFGYPGTDSEPNSGYLSARAEEKIPEQSVMHIEENRLGRAHNSDDRLSTLFSESAVIGGNRSPQLGAPSMLNSNHSPSRQSPSTPGRQAQISEIMLKTLALDILSTKGPLPVGEIGKMLQEAIRVPSLSSILREYFGGLKKFLEKYSDDFLISNDHPFNPNVYIRSTLTTDDLAVIAKGRMPMHFELTYKKKGANRKKNNKNQGNYNPAVSQLPSGDDIQSQLTRYFSSLPLSSAGHSSNQASSAGFPRVDSWGHTKEKHLSDRQWESRPRGEPVDKSMRRRSYPHEDLNASRMLKSLFGNDDEPRLSDPFPSEKPCDSFSHLLDGEIFGSITEPPGHGGELWAQGISNLHHEADTSYGQPNPQAPVFVPQRSRFSS